MPWGQVGKVIKLFYMFAIWRFIYLYFCPQKESESNHLAIKGCVLLFDNLCEQNKLFQTGFLAIGVLLYTQPWAGFKLSLYSSWKHCRHNNRLQRETSQWEFFSVEQQSKSPLFPTVSTPSSIQVTVKEISISQKAMIESWTLQSKDKLSPMPHINFISAYMFLFCLPC